MAKTTFRNFDFLQYFVPTFEKLDSAPETRQSKDSEYVHKP